MDEGEEGDDVVHMWKIKRKGWGNRARVVSGAAEDFAANYGTYRRGLQREVEVHLQLWAKRHIYNNAAATTEVSKAVCAVT